MLRTILQIDLGDGCTCYLGRAPECFFKLDVTVLWRLSWHRKSFIQPLLVRVELVKLIPHVRRLVGDLTLNQMIFERVGLLRAVVPTSLLQVPLVALILP